MPRDLFWRFVPERRLAALTAVLSLPWMLPGRVGVVAGIAGGALAAGAAALDLLLLPSRRQITAQRLLPESIGIGDTRDAAISVQNAAARPYTVRVFDVMPPALGGGTDGAMVLTVSAGAAASVTLPLTGRVRGVAQFGALGLRITTALGLIGRRTRIPTTDHVRVVPSLRGVRRFRLLALQHRLRLAGARTLRRKGDGQGFAGLREYVRGDDPRHIDWKATSRRGTLITREFTIERSQTVFTLIDAGRLMTQLVGEFPRFEHALSAALVLTDIAAHAGDRVGTCVFDDQVRAFVPAMKSRGALQAIRDAFVPVIASSHEPDYASAFRFLAANQKKRALVVLFTDVIDVRASQALLAHVSRSAARHLVLVVALRNDAVIAAANPAAGDTSTALYEAAAAEELLQAREAVLERMRRAGASVLDVSPTAMTAALVNRYLELKSRGAL